MIFAPNGTTVVEIMPKVESLPSVLPSPCVVLASPKIRLCNSLTRNLLLAFDSKFTRSSEFLATPLFTFKCP